jgi:MFS family permease
LLDPKTWLFAIIAGTNSTILAASGAFLPTIIKELGYTNLQAQLLTVIPYAVAFVAMLIVGFLSDRYRNKSYFLLGSSLVILVGLVILISTTSQKAGMVGATLFVGGAYPAAILQLAWVVITFAGFTKRAMSWGVSMVFGQGFSILATQIYTNPPRFIKGHGILIGFTVASILSTLSLQVIMSRANQMRDAELQQYRDRDEVHPDERKTLEETCDDHINFRYIA